jgi:hypothetical protein
MKFELVLLHVFISILRYFFLRTVISLAKFKNLTANCKEQFENGHVIDVGTFTIHESIPTRFH